MNPHHFIDMGAKQDYWVSRWDSMQEFYNPDRKKRFAALVSLIKAKCPEPKRILDLGCGTGSIMEECLNAFPAVHIIGVDLDFTLLALAQSRLKKFAPRFTTVEADFREENWSSGLPTDFDAVVSATALHWLSESQLALLYSHIHRLLKVTGIFLNADHVGSSDASLQKAWIEQKKRLRPPLPQTGEPWESFWNDYLNELGSTANAKRSEAIGAWNGVEDGLPLDWHFEKLKQAGFRKVDCYYRFYADAIYGAVK